jgi:hypothetical protein
MTVKLKGQWKKDTREYNGLDHEATRKGIIAQPLQRIVVVGVVECTKVEDLVQEGGTRVPTMNFVQIEAVEGDPAVVVQEILDNAFRVRTGRDVQRSLFDVDDPEANEDAAAILAGGGLAKREVKCGATSTHPEHSGDDWVCRGLASAGGEGVTVVEAGNADSGRRELPAAPEFSDQTPDGDGPTDGGSPRRTRKRA